MEFTVYMTQTQTAVWYEPGEKGSDEGRSGQRG